MDKPRVNLGRPDKRCCAMTYMEVEGKKITARDINVGVKGSSRTEETQFLVSWRVII